LVHSCSMAERLWCGLCVGKGHCMCVGVCISALCSMPRQARAAVLV